MPTHSGGLRRAFPLPGGRRPGAGGCGVSTLVRGLIATSAALLVGMQSGVLQRLLFPGLHGGAGGAGGGGDAASLLAALEAATDYDGEGAAAAAAVAAAGAAGGAARRTQATAGRHPRGDPRYGPVDPAVVAAVHADCFAPPPVSYGPTPGLASADADDAHPEGRLAYTWRLQRVAYGQYRGEPDLLVYPNVRTAPGCAGATAEDVVPVTHMTPERLPAVKLLVSRWVGDPGRPDPARGCISLSLLLCDAGDWRSFLSEYERSPGFAQHVSLHVVVGRRTKATYPFNVMRNAALEPWNSLLLGDLKRVRSDAARERSQAAHAVALRKLLGNLGEGGGKGRVLPGLRLVPPPGAKPGAGGGGKVRAPPPLSPAYPLGMHPHDDGSAAFEATVVTWGGGANSGGGLTLPSVPLGGAGAAPAAGGAAPRQPPALGGGSKAGAAGGGDATDVESLWLRATGRGDDDGSGGGGGAAPRPPAAAGGSAATALAAGVPQGGVIGQVPAAVAAGPGRSAGGDATAAAAAADEEEEEEEEDDEEEEGAAAPGAGAAGRPRGVGGAARLPLAAAADDVSGGSATGGYGAFDGGAEEEGEEEEEEEEEGGAGGVGARPAVAAGGAAPAPAAAAFRGRRLLELADGGGSGRTGSQHAALQRAAAAVAAGGADAGAGAGGATTASSRDHHRRALLASLAHALPRPWLMVLDADALPSVDEGRFRELMASVTAADAAVAGGGGGAAGGAGQRAAGGGAAAPPPPGVVAVAPRGLGAAFNPGGSADVRGVPGHRRLYSVLSFESSAPPGSPPSAQHALFDAFLATPPRNTTADLHGWLRLAYGAKAARIFSDFTKGAYRGTMPVRTWLRADGPYHGPHPVRVEYMPKHEPYFLAKPPLPPFPEIYRGRGYSKSGWFFELAGPEEYTLHALPEVFFMVDTRADSYRFGAGKAGGGGGGANDDAGGGGGGGGGGPKINKAKTRPRATNMAFFNALMRSYGIAFDCRPAGCWFTRAPVPGRVGRPRLESLEPL